MGEGETREPPGNRSAQAPMCGGKGGSAFPKREFGIRRSNGTLFPVPGPEPPASSDVLGGSAHARTCKPRVRRAWVRPGVDVEQWTPPGGRAAAPCGSQDRNHVYEYNVQNWLAHENRREQKERLSEDTLSGKKSRRLVTTRGRDGGK
jgi:hypothetical protein